MVIHEHYSFSYAIVNVRCHKILEDTNTAKPNSLFKSRPKVYLKVNLVHLWYIYRWILIHTVPKTVTSYLFPNKCCVRICDIVVHSFELYIRALFLHIYNRIVCKQTEYEFIYLVFSYIWYYSIDTSILFLHCNRIVYWG